MVLLVTRRRVIAGAALLFTLFVAGCDTPDTVSKYCASSLTALSSVTAVLSDMQPSCLRAVNEDMYVPGAFKAPITTTPGCTDIQTQQSSAVAATKLLSEYFTALNSLSTVGSTTASTDAGTLATNAAGIAGATAAQKDALSSLAQDLTKSIMSGYQYKKIAADLPKAQKDVDQIVDALVAVINNNYLGQLLADEDKKSPNAYKVFLQQYKPPSPEAILALDQRWQLDEQAIATKRASAKSAVAALNTMKAGFDTLAANAATMKPKDVASLLAPYASQLQSLIPQMQKAF